MPQDPTWSSGSSGKNYRWSHPHSPLPPRNVLPPYAERLQYWWQMFFLPTDLQCFLQAMWGQHCHGVSPAPVVMAYRKVLKALYDTLRNRDDAWYAYTACIKPDPIGPIDWFSVGLPQMGWKSWTCCHLIYIVLTWQTLQGVHLEAGLKAFPAVKLFSFSIPNIIGRKHQCAKQHMLKPHLKALHMLLMMQS